MASYNSWTDPVCEISNQLLGKLIILKEIVFTFNFTIVKRIQLGFRIKLYLPGCKDLFS